MQIDYRGNKKSDLENIFKFFVMKNAIFGLNRKNNTKNK